MAGGNDETNQGNNQDAGERKKPPKEPDNSVETSTVAAGSSDFDKSMREEREKADAAIRAGVATAPIELEHLGVRPVYGPETNLQTRESIEVKEKPLTAQDQKLLQEGRQRFFEPGVDERSRLIALRDSFDAIAADRGAANSKGIIREGRNLLGLSNYLAISEALTSVDGGRSQAPQRKEIAAKQLTESLKEIKRLSQASPPGESAQNLQILLGGREGLDKLLEGLSSKDSKERDEAMKALAKAVSGGEGWSADNALTRAFHEKGQARAPGQADSSIRIIGMPQLLDGGLTSLDAETLIVLDTRGANLRRSRNLPPGGSTDSAIPDLSSGESNHVTALASLLAAQLESRRLMQTNGALDGSGNFQFNFGDRVGRPETLSQRIGSVTPFMLNPQLMLPDPRLTNPRLGNDPLSALLRPNESIPLLGDPLQLRLDGGRSLGGPDALRFPFGDPLRSARRAEMQAPGWLPAAEAVRDLSSATNSGEALLAIKKLGGLAQVGDQHAQRALAATLLGLTTPPAGMELARRSIASNEPVFTPDLSRLDQGTRDALKKFALSELGGNGMMFVLPEGQGSEKLVLLDMQNLPIDTKRLQLSAGKLPKEALTCLALAIGSGLPSTATESERATMQAMLARQANTDTGAYAIMDALGTHGAQRNDTLEQMLVSGLNGRRGDYFLDHITQGAKTGNDVALGILARALGTEGMEPQKAERCFEALKQAAENGHAEKVAKILLEQHAKYGDNGGVLNCLGAIAQDGKIPWQQTSKILDVLRKDVASDDPETHQSAIKGFMRLSKFWSSSDLRLIADNVSDTTVQGLRDVVSSANPEAASLLSKRLVENLNSGTYSDVHHQAAAVTALGVLPDYAPTNSAAVIKEAVTTQRFAGDKDADRLTMAGVHSLMRIGGSRGAASELALDALREPGFRNTANLKLEQESVRRELADYVTGRITRADMSAESKAATFNSGFPQSLHSLLRERGVHPSEINSLVERARNNYDDTTIRSVMNRVELYNSLPPQVRDKILAGTTSSGDTKPQPRMDVGPPSRAALITMQSKAESDAGASAGQMDVLTVFGQMANGKLEGSPNSVLLDPLETKVKEIFEDTARRRRESSEEYQKNEGEIQDRLRDLTTHTAKGVSTWQHFKGWFGDSTLSDFIVVQDKKLQSYNNELGDRTSLTSSIRNVNNEHELYSVALDAMEYRRLRNEGHEGEADRLALSMLKDHGPALATIAPAVWKDLGFAVNSSGEVVLGNGDGETVWQRLNRQKAGGSSNAPVLSIGEQGGVAKGIQALSAKHNVHDEDFAARRQLALMSIDTDPTIKPFKETAMDLQKTLPDLDKLLRAGLEGTRGPKYVEDLRSKVGSLQRSIDAMNLKDENGISPLDRTRQSVQELKNSLPKLDATSQKEVMERIEALEKMIEVFDPESQTGMNIKLLIDKVNSSDFNESGFITWLKGDGIKTIAAVGAAVVAAVAVGSALATFGATSPLAAAAVTVAVAAAATVGGIAGYELSAELLYRVGSGERTGAQIMHARRGGLVDGKDGNAKRLTYGDAAADYGWQFAQGFVISLATMGAGAALGKGFSTVAGKFLSRASAAETQTMARIGARAAQLEKAAEKVGGQELKKRWMERLGAQIRAEFVDELKDEAYEKGAEIGIEHFAGKTNPAMSVFASALIASRKGLSGIDLHPQAGGSIEMNFGPGVNQAEMMSIFRDQMLTDGLQVDWNGQADSPMTVKTPEGYSVDVKLKGAAQQAGSDQAGSTQTDATQQDGADDLAKLSRDGANGPAFEADHKTAHLGKLEAALELEGANLRADERAARLSEIEGLKADILQDFKNEAATQLSRATGLSQQQAAAIVDGLNIQLQPYNAATTRAGAFKNADGSLTMQVGGDMPQAVSPHKTFVHEFTHALDAARYSALHAANPNAFVDALVADVTSNSFTGKTGIWNKPGARNTSDMLYTRQRSGENGLTEADVSFARDMLGNYMRQNAADGKLPETPSATALSDWIKANGGQFPNSKNEGALLAEMVREISHANMVFAESQLGADAMKNPAMQKMVQAFAASQSADPTVIRHMMRGVSDATTAMADGTHYDFGSRYENRANRLQARATIEASQNAMPALTSELLAATKGKPAFAALNAKLETLMARKDESVRRAGVRQSEYFASAEGQAQLAKLKADSSMAGILAEQISGNVRARQDALSTQKFLTALDMLPARKAQLDAADSGARAGAQRDYLNTIQSLYANGKASDLPNLTRFLNSSGLASGDQVLSALTADSGALLANRDNATISKVVQSLEASGLSRTRILEVLADASTGSPALSIKLAEISSALPPPVEVQNGSQTLAEGWKSTLDSLSKVEAISKFNRASTQSALSSDIESTVADWTPAREQFDNLRMLQDRAEHAAKQEAAWKALGPDAEAQTAHWAKLKTDFGKTAADVTAELAPEISKRADALQSSLNRTLAANNLPAANITVANSGSSTNNGANTPPARYNPATGNIEVSAELLLTASPSEISNLVRAEYAKSLAHQTAKAAAENEGLSQTERDAAARVNEMFAVQAAADAKVEQLCKRLETLEDNRRLLLSEGGIQTLMGRMSAKDANIESILGIAPPPELNALLTKYQQARKPDGTVDTKKWTLESDQAVSSLLFPSVYKAGMQTRSDLQNARADAPPTAGESAYDRAGIDNSFVDAIASTPFSPDFSAQMDQRINLAMDHSWAMPDRASLAAIYDFAGENGVVEVGAGKGVWAGALRRMGLPVAAYDINANNVQDNPYHRGESVSTVEQGGVEKASEHPDKTLLLSWPTPGEPMGADALKAYTEAGGTKLAFIGERPTPGSDDYNTGDKQFHEALNKNWVLKEVVEMPHVPDGMSLSTSKLYLYERRGTTSPELVKASKLPETPSTTEILDRAAENGDLLPKHRATFEKAIQDGLLKPEELADIFSKTNRVNREVVVQPLLASEKLSQTGASTLASLNNAQLNALSDLSSAKLDSFVNLINNPQISRQDIGAFLAKPAAQRTAFENLLLGGRTPPSAEASAKILKMSDSTAADLNTMIGKSAEQRKAVLDFVQTAGSGEISFTALVSTRQDLSSAHAASILKNTVRKPDVASDATQKAAADRDLALVTETLRGLDTTTSSKLLEDMATGKISASEVARLQEAAQRGLIGSSALPMSEVLNAPATRRNALLSMLESERAASPENRLGPQGLERVFRQGTRITTAVERGVTSYGEIHSLMTGSPSDAVAAEIILKQGSSDTALSRQTVEGLIAASRDGSISVTGLEALRSAMNDGVMSPGALTGILAQPAEVRSQLSQQFEKLWSMRRSVHDTHLDRPIAERSAAVIESDNKKFIERFVSELQNHPGDSATAKMAEERLSGFHTPSLAELEPALVPRAEPMELKKPIGNAPAEVQAFAAAMAKGDLREAIRLGMADRDGLSDNFTNVKIDFADLSNPEQVAAVIEKMDKIGFASGYEGRGESGSIADLARPVITLPNGKLADLSGPDIKLMVGVPTAQDQKFIDLLENDPAVRVLRGRVALTAYEERIIHSDQGRGGAKSSLVRDAFTQSKEYAEMEKYYRDRDPARMQEAMREIDVAARLVESGMSLKDVRELMGSRHLGGEREFFYNWFAGAHPDRVAPAVEARTAARPSWGIGQEIVLDGSDGKPVDPVLEQWVRNAKERLQLDPDEALALEQALESGEAKFVTLDRKALEALEVEQDIYSFEGGREVNSSPYESAGRRKSPLQHADKYDPATHVEAALIVKGKVDGRDRYFVVNGCRRIHVFGSETTNPDNRSIPVLLFENAAAFTRAISHDPRSSFRKATPFSFEVE